MGYDLSIIALLLFISTFIYLYWGIYIIRLNSKASANRLFLLISISMCIWSFGFAMTYSAKNLGAALFWQRYSAIGWATAYSFMLHFLLLLSNEDSTLKQRRLWSLLHIPAIISMYVFGLSNKMAPVQYNLLKIEHGWINKLTNNGWDGFFNIYYISYILLSILVVWKWQKKLEDKRIAKGAQRIIEALFVTFILGTFTDRVVSAVFQKPLPQMAPLFILLPSWAMYYSARYYGVLNKDDSHRADIIVTEEDKKNIFNNMSVAFYMGSILTFLYEYVAVGRGSKGFKAGVLKGLMLLGIGLSIRAIQNIKKESLKENLTIIALVLSIPVTLLQFVEYGSTSIWSFPMIIIIMSIIFSKRTLLIAATAVAIISQIVICITYPQIIVVINQYHYIARIGMIIIAFLMGTYINKLYFVKIKENQSQIELQKLNLELSFDFTNINQENFDEKINLILFKIGRFFGVDRTYLSLINHENNTLTYSHLWCKGKSMTEVVGVKKTDFPISPWLMAQLKAGNVFYMEDISKMPNDARWERDRLMAKKVKSLLAVPVEDNGIIYGFVGIDAVTPFKSWSQQEIEFINIVSNLLSGGLSKIETEKEINFMAYHDHLTKLPNRFLFSDRVNKAIDLAKRTGKIVSVIFIDLDNFKIVNDTMGHNTGDHLLKEIAGVLGEIIKQNGVVSRSGGDEFMIMLNNISNYDEILKIADNLIDFFSKPFNINGRNFLITASMGISIYPRDGQNAETLAQNADLAMYEAKEQGKNQYVLCTSSLKEKVQLNMKLSNDMYYALERNEFVVYYQPQVDLATGDINGLEALLRWNHPEKGMISPGVFIPLAENNGMINSIGEWVLRTASSQGKKWQSMGFGNLRMAVNLSGVQFADLNIADSIENILKETGLSPEDLEIEITESIAIKQEAHAEEVLNRLKKIGVCIAIDDFGTEYSSLNRLKSLPIDRIKIDMQFTQGIENSEKDRAIVMVIINLAKRLGMSVIAEGAETKEQVEFLHKELCDDVQGYYYYKPMPAQEIQQLLMQKG